MKKFLIVLTLSILASCSKGEVSESVSRSEQPMQIFLSPLEALSPDLRSSLSSALEDKIRDAAVAAYDRETGILADAVYSDAAPSLNLMSGRVYNIYALANMGDVTDAFPVSESDVRKLRFALPSFSSLENQGLPMAAMTSSAASGSLSMQLKRMVAKVNITIDHSDMDAGGSDRSFSNTVVKVHRAAKAIYPFAEGGSAALNKDDLYQDVTDFQTISDGYADVSEKLVLYVPENMQGNLGGDNDDPWGKSESEDDSGLSLCTFISLEGVKDGTVDGVEGDMVYRFFPGEDNTRNFDLQGNKVYDISMELTWDGMYVADNWKVEKNNWSDSRRILVSTSEDHGYSASASLVIPRGAEDFPVYVYYSPHGMPYESEEDGGEGHHYGKGWVFMLSHHPSGSPGPTAPQPNTSDFSGSYMSTGFVGHTAYRTVHYITIPPATPAGYSNRIMYRTADGRREAWLDIEVIEAGSPGLGVGDDENDGGGEIEY